MVVSFGVGSPSGIFEVGIVPIQVHASVCALAHVMSFPAMVAQSHHGYAKDLDAAISFKLLRIFGFVFV